MSLINEVKNNSYLIYTTEFPKTFKSSNKKLTTIKNLSNLTKETYLTKDKVIVLNKMLKQIYNLHMNFEKLKEKKTIDTKIEFNKLINIDGVSNANLTTNDKVSIIRDYNIYSISKIVVHFQKKYGTSLKNFYEILNEVKSDIEYISLILSNIPVSKETTQIGKRITKMQEFIDFDYVRYKHVENINKIKSELVTVYKNLNKVVSKYVIKKINMKY